MPCALCYSLDTEGPNARRCEHNGCARSYCSATCQSSDWHTQGHKQWCGKSSERGTGYSIKDAGVGRGDGVFALHAFSAGEKIMVERSAIGAAFETPCGSAALLALPTGVKAALARLSSAASESASAPVGDEIAGMLQRKFTNNAMGLGDATRSSGLFLTIAKVNHACAGNSEHYYLAEDGLMLLVATKDIAAGDEITFSYVHSCANQAQRATKLQHWGIVCDCSACVVPPGGSGSVGADLNSITRLDAKLVAQGSRGQVVKALATGHRLLALYERSGLGSLMLTSRTYFDMYELASLEPSMRTDAKRFLHASIALDTRFFGRSDLDICQSKHALAAGYASPGSESGGEGSSGEEGGSSGSSGSGSVDDGCTSDEGDFPRACAAPATHYSRGAAIDGAAASEAAFAAGITAGLAADGAAMLSGVLLRDACAAAQAAVLRLRDDLNLSHIFSSPTSSRAPPCAAECVWLCDTAFSASARGAGGGEDGAAAIRLAVEACAAQARRALASMGYAPVDVCQLGVPMASVGTEPALTERFHLGHEGSPALPHHPLDGLDAAGSRGLASALLLTSTLILDEGQGGGESTPTAVEGATGGSSSAADNVATQVAALRTRATARAPAAASEANTVGSKRPHGSGDGEDGVVEVSYYPEAGDLLLIAPRTARSLSGGRVSITMWWQLSDTAAARRAAEATHVRAADSAPTAPVVYDGVLSPLTCAALSAMPPVRFNVYDRSHPPCNAHEELIESMLLPLRDESRYIEYWGRRVWSAVPAHSDLDEIPLLAPLLPGGEPPRPRFPLWAHVAYLEVAGGIAAPTVLWDDEHARSRRIHVVPAVKARLLRFNGSWVHAVPKPAAEYLGEEQTEADEAEEEARGGVLRNVLLFNSWADAPPEGQPSRPVGTADPHPHPGSDPESATAGGSDGLTAANAPGMAVATATPFDQWQPSPILARTGQVDGHDAAAESTPADEDARLPSTTAFVARLMGGPRRRGRSERYRCDALKATREAVQEALHAPATPSSFRVR